MDYSRLHWSSDCGGDEVGFPEVNVVGLYSFKEFPEIYIETETGRILESWVMNDD